MYKNNNNVSFDIAALVSHDGWDLKPNSAPNKTQSKY